MDNLEAWEEFSKQMEKHIEMKEAAYKTNDGFDLLSDTDEIICRWNVLKYALRVWHGEKKGGDYFKIAHYAQTAWQKSKNGN